MDPVTIVSIISLATKVISNVNKVITFFDKQVNTPKELHSFHSTIERLQIQFEAFQLDLERSGSTLLREQDVQEVKETMFLCNQLFDEAEARALGGGFINGALRINWTIWHTATLDRYRAKIKDHYEEIIFPTWLALISSKLPIPALLDDQNHLPNPGQNPDPGLNSNVPIVSSDILENLSQGITKLKATEDRQITERILHDLEQTLQQCWQQIGLQIGNIFESAGLTAPCYLDRRRPSMLESETAPTTLSLKISSEESLTLTLERVLILARDDSSRILQYENKDKSVHVTHIVNKGSLPWTTEVQPRRVSFLAQHTITVVDNKGYQLYQLDPRYIFKDPKMCKRFLSIFREREVLEAFEHIEIKRAGSIISRREIIRFWRRPASERENLVTMTFLENSGDGKNKERNLDRFRRDSKYVVPLFMNYQPSQTLDLFSRDANESLRIKFVSIEGATNFKNHWELIHPSNPPAPQIPAPSVSASSSTTPAQTPTLSAGTQTSAASIISLGPAPATPTDDFLGAVLAAGKGPKFE